MHLPWCCNALNFLNMVRPHMNCFVTQHCIACTTLQPQISLFCILKCTHSPQPTNIADLSRESIPRIITQYERSPNTQGITKSEQVTDWREALIKETIDIDQSIWRLILPSEKKIQISKSNLKFNDGVWLVMSYFAISNTFRQHVTLSNNLAKVPYLSWNYAYLSFLARWPTNSINFTLGWYFRHAGRVFVLTFGLLFIFSVRAASPLGSDSELSQVHRLHRLCLSQRQRWVSVREDN